MLLRCGLSSDSWKANTSHLRLFAEKTVQAIVSIAQTKCFQGHYFVQSQLGEQHPAIAGRVLMVFEELLVA